MPNPSLNSNALPRKGTTACAVGLAALIALVLTPTSPARSAAPGRVIDVPILTYHRVATRRSTLPKVTLQLTVSPTAFAQQMHWLAHHGYHPITVAELYAALHGGVPLPARPVVITFDDGYRDVLTQAAPVLARLRFPAIAFVITGRISGSDPSFLTWGELTRLEADGVEIGSHTVTHLDLLAATPSEAYGQLVQSRRTLEARLGHPVRWFAYPYGGEDPAVASLVHRAGYLLAMTTQEGAQQSSAAPFALHRTEVAGQDTLTDFAWILTHDGLAGVHQPGS